MWHCLFSESLSWCPADVVHSKELQLSSCDVEQGASFKVGSSIVIPQNTIKPPSHNLCMYTQSISSLQAKFLHFLLTDPLMLSFSSYSTH